MGGADSLLLRAIERAEAALRALLATDAARAPRVPRRSPSRTRRADLPSRRARDSQRAKLYASEKGVPRGRRFATFAECEAYVDRVVHSPWWRSRFPHVRAVEVKDGRGRRHAGGSALHRFVTLPRWARSELIVLHELAHVADHPHNAGHGPEFVGIYLDLVREFLGERFERRLLRNCETNGVRFDRQPSQADLFASAPSTR